MPMEEPDGRCGVVYYCPSASTLGDVSHTYRSDDPPGHDQESGDGAGHPSWTRIHGNVCALLDEDQGGFHEVFISSNLERCLDQLEQTAAAIPTAVLVELRTTFGDSPSIHLATDHSSALSLLRSLSANVRGGRYRQPVLPFVLLASELPLPADAPVATTYLSAGALCVAHSPLDYRDIGRIVGHVKEATRPPARLIGASMAQNLIKSMRTEAVAKVPLHRPDERIPYDRRQVIEEAVGNWHFSAHEFDMEELTYAAVYMLEHMLTVPELAPYSLSRVELMAFVLATRRQYKHERHVHYHNWRHAVDVTQSLYCFMLDTGLCPSHTHDHRDHNELNPLERLLTPFDGLILLCSAIGHDVGHPGVNNAFLVACHHSLAQMYNDKSVLENYHCAAYSQLLRRHWPSLSNAIGFRATMISTVLATDMQRHFEYMVELAKLKHMVQNADPDLGDWSAKDRAYARELVMALLMKAADISNVARPFEVSSHWASTLINEFARQGELEAELEMPTCLFGGPPNKEDALAAAQSQKGFMSLFGLPLFQGLNEVIPSVSCAIQELSNNEQIWDERIAEEKQRRGTGHQADVPLTLSSVPEAEVDEANARRHKSDPSAAPVDGLIAATSSSPRPAVDNDSIRSAQEERHFNTYNKRSSAPLLPTSIALPPSFPSPHAHISRRSSKDVALDQLQQLSLFAHSSLSPGSRRGSADASAAWHIHQSSYPGSRRGSKDDSLTTILVTSQGSPGRRSSPSSPPQALVGKAPGSAGSPGPGVKQTMRQSLPHSQRNARSSIPSSRSHATSSATASTLPTQPSSLYAPTDDEWPMPVPPRGHGVPVPVTEDPFLTPGSPSKQLDGAMSIATGKDTGASLASPSSSPRMAGRAPSDEESDGRGMLGARGTEEKGLRESRSRSRLRGLRFWRKKSWREAGIGEGEGGAGGTWDGGTGSP